MHRPVALFAVVFLAAPAAAQIILPAEPGDGLGAAPLTVRNQHIVVEIDSQIARTRVLQVFENHTDQVLEGTFVFALPERAAVSGFATWVDGHRVESRVLKKAEAEKTYEKAARSGRAPGLLERLGPGMFRIRVEGIVARGTKRTELRYSEVLPYQDGEVTMRIPLKVDGIDAPQVADFRINIALKDRTKKIGQIWSTTHEVIVKRTGPRTATVSFTRPKYQAEKDLVLRYQVESDELGFTFMTHRMRGEDGYFLLSIAPQELTESSDIVKKDVAFVFDTSGSMGGAKIEQARDAMTRCLGFLNPEDGFAVLGFSDALNPWRKKIVEATPTNLAKARAFVDNLRAGGGTNIDGALRSALDTLEGRGRPGVIIFFTDGTPTMGETNPARILSNVVAANADGIRIFTFGVGRGVNKGLLDELARKNRGISEYVQPGQSIGEVVAGFYSKISRPVLSDIDFDYDPVTVLMQYPTVMPDIYKGQQLIIAGRYRDSGKGVVVLTGSLNGTTKRFEVPVDFPEVNEDDKFVARLWARRRVQFLLDEMKRNGERPEGKDEVVRLAQNYHLITPYTSMVAVPEPRLASLSPSRIKPGDPEIIVRTGKDARSVTVFLPFGEVHRASWENRRGVWVTRFLIPTDVADGVYPVQVVVVHGDGSTQRIALKYTVDTRSPVMQAEALPRVTAGELLTLRAWPRVNAMDLAAALFASSAGDAVEVAKSFSDVKRVTATLWNGREIELGIEPGERGWTAQVETPRNLPAGTYPLILTAVDWAGNLHRQTLHLDVVAGPLTGR